MMFLTPMKITVTYFLNNSLFNPLKDYSDSPNLLALSQNYDNGEVSIDYELPIVSSIFKYLMNDKYMSMLGLPNGGCLQKTLRVLKIAKDSNSDETALINIVKENNDVEDLENYLNVKINNLDDIISTSFLSVSSIPLVFISLHVALPIAGYAMYKGLNQLYFINEKYQIKEYCISQFKHAFKNGEKISDILTSIDQVNDGYYIMALYGCTISNSEDISHAIALIKKGGDFYMYDCNVGLFKYDSKNLDELFKLLTDKYHYEKIDYLKIVY